MTIGEHQVATIRRVLIENFRCIKRLEWFPSSRVNCIIGPGDSGKSTVLDAIDACIGARRSFAFGDGDFYDLDFTKPITVALTLGDLPEGLKNLDIFGLYIRGFNADTRTIVDEPDDGFEPVLTVQLTVGSDLEPVWELVSDRAAAQGQSRSFRLRDRTLVSPVRLGPNAVYHLTWSRNSVLNKLTVEDAELSSSLADAARKARETFGDSADTALKSTLELIQERAKELGIPVGGEVRALLNAHSVSFNEGAISLHSKSGVPLQNLGTGSIRLLTAGLQRAAASTASILLADELEYGLEPHRVIRLLESLAVHDPDVALQTFLTTHSPVAIRELAVSQLFILRHRDGAHEMLELAAHPDLQGTVRAYPEALLAPTLIGCEGPTEIGLLRGLDAYFAERGTRALSAAGVSLVNLKGSSPDVMLKKAEGFARLGYRIHVLFDGDKPPSPAAIASFQSEGGELTMWDAGRNTESEICESFPDEVRLQLLRLAAELNDRNDVDHQLRSHSAGKFKLEDLETILDIVGSDQGVVDLLAFTADKNGWFKSIGKMATLARSVLAPNLDKSTGTFKQRVLRVLDWAQRGA